MPSDAYCLIWRALHAREQLTFSYGDKRREAFPVILGYAADGQEKLFAYQVGGATSPGAKLPEWRCLFVNRIQDLRSRRADWHEGTSHRQTQTCVHFVNVDVNIPETLAHAKPLAFGVPELRQRREPSR